MNTNTFISGFSERLFYGSRRMAVISRQNVLLRVFGHGANTKTGKTIRREGFGYPLSEVADWQS